jgi:hypothetical protein
MIKISKSILEARKKVEAKILKKATTEKFLDIIQNLNTNLEAAFQATNLIQSPTSAFSPIEVLFNSTVSESNNYNFESTLSNTKDFDVNLKDAINIAYDSITNKEYGAIYGDEYFNYQRLSTLSKDQNVTNVNGVTVKGLIEACELMGTIKVNGCEFYVKNFNVFLTGVTTVINDNQALALTPDTNNDTSLTVIATAESLGQFYAVIDTEL